MKNERVKSEQPHPPPLSPKGEGEGKLKGEVKRDAIITRVELSSCQPGWLNFLRKAHNSLFNSIL